VSTSPGQGDITVMEADVTDPAALVRKHGATVDYDWTLVDCYWINNGLIMDWSLVNNYWILNTSEYTIDYYYDDWWLFSLLIHCYWWWLTTNHSHVLMSVYKKQIMETFQLWTFSHSGHTSFFTWCFAAANAVKGQPRCWGQALWLLASPGCCVLPGEPIWWAPGEGDDGCFLIIQLTGNKRIFNSWLGFSVFFDWMVMWKQLLAT